MKHPSLHTSCANPASTSCAPTPKTDVGFIIRSDNRHYVIKLEFPYQAGLSTSGLNKFTQTLPAAVENKLNYTLFEINTKKLEDKSSVRVKT